VLNAAHSGKTSEATQVKILPVRLPAKTAMANMVTMAMLARSPEGDG
jgi:hypothetical protein